MYEIRDYTLSQIKDALDTALQDYLEWMEYVGRDNEEACKVYYDIKNKIEEVLIAYQDKIDQEAIEEDRE